MAVLRRPLVVDKLGNCRGHTSRDTGVGSHRTVIPIRAVLSPFRGKQSGHLGLELISIGSDIARSLLSLAACLLRSLLHHVQIPSEVGVVGIASEGLLRVSQQLGHGIIYSHNGESTLLESPYRIVVGTLHLPQRSLMAFHACHHARMSERSSRHLPHLLGCPWSSMQRSKGEQE